MLSRRTFVTALAAVSGMFGIRSSRATSAPVAHVGMPSDNLARLADLWDAAACNFDVVRRAMLFPVGGIMGGDLMPPNSAQMERYHAAGRTMLEHADRVFREPSRKGADVLLKYDLIDQLMDGRHVPNRDAVIAAGGGEWHRIVEQEAQNFGLKLNPFWLWEKPRTPMIDGDPHAAVANRVLRRKSNT